MHAVHKVGSITFATTGPWRQMVVPLVVFTVSTLASSHINELDTGKEPSRHINKNYMNGLNNNITKATGKSNAKVDYTGAQVWKVLMEKREVRMILRELQHRDLISTWAANHTHMDIMIKSNVVSNLTSFFTRRHILYDVMIDDLQKRIDEENPPLDEHEIELQNKRGHRMTWKRYHRVKDIYDYMDYLADTYSDYAEVKSIGKSYAARDLKVLRISNGNPDNNAIFIDGGTHAREWISTSTVTYIMNHIAENFDDESDEITNVDWYFLPVANPDGYEYTFDVDRLWRKNRKPNYYGSSICMGTDLNRNYGYRWGNKGATENPCGETYQGTNAFSEPESRAVADFIKNRAPVFRAPVTKAPVSAYMSYHSYGQYVLYPWGYDEELAPDHEDLDFVGNLIAKAIAEKGGSNYKVGATSKVLYAASGSSHDWHKSEGVQYPYTIELRDTGNYGFVLPASYIVPVAEEALNGLRVLAGFLY